METTDIRKGRSDTAALRNWLGGHWALYFSHPNDFARYDFEADRWHLMIEGGFNAAKVRALRSVQCGGLPGATWIETVGGKSANLSGPTGVGRFVAIYDDSLRLRCTFSYTPAQLLPSPLEIATTAVALRQRLARENIRRASRLKCAALGGVVAAASVFAVAHFRARQAKATV